MQLLMGSEYRVGVAFEQLYIYILNWEKEVINLTG